MLPKCADGYSRMSKELQVWSLAAGAAATLIFIAMKLEAHVDLIEPGIHHIIQEEIDRRNAEMDYERYDQAYFARVESDHQREYREFCEQKDREFHEWYEHRYDNPCAWDNPSGASYDHDRD